MKGSITQKNLLMAGMMLLASFSFSSCGSSRKTVAVEEGWDIIAERKINFVRDKDEVPISSTTQYTALRLRIEDRNVDIDKMVIYFKNGDKLEPAISALEADQDSRIIDFGRDGRTIDHLEFKYRTKGSVLKGRANMIVFGKRYGWRGQGY